MDFPFFFTIFVLFAHLYACTAITDGIGAKNRVLALCWL